MSLDKELNNQLNEFRKGKAQTFVAIVQSVSKDEKTCMVVDDLNIEYDDVRLSSSIDITKKVVLYPKIGSYVLCSLINNEDNVLYVSGFNEIESIEGEIESTHFIINKEGFIIQRNAKNLYTTLEKLFSHVQELADEVNKIKVAIGTSPNIPVIEAIKQKIKTTIQEDLHTILK